MYWTLPCIYSLNSTWLVSTFYFLFIIYFISPLATALIHSDMDRWRCSYLGPLYGRGGGEVGEGLLTWWEAKNIEWLCAQLYRDHVTARDRVQYDEPSYRCADCDEPTRRFERHRHTRLLFTDNTIQYVVISLVPAYNENGTARHYNVNKW